MIKEWYELPILTSNLQVSLNTRDLLLASMQAVRIQQAQNITQRPYLYNIYTVSGIGVTWYNMFCFEVNDETILINNFNPKTLPQYVFAYCSCNDFKEIHNINIPCKHIYKVILSIKSNNFINVYSKINNLKTNYKAKQTKLKLKKHYKNKLKILFKEINYLYRFKKYSSSIKVIKLCNLLISEHKREIKNIIAFLNS